MKGSNADLVAGFYNKTAQTQTVDAREESEILGLRRFNNFIKSVLLKNSIDSLRQTFDEIRVLDLCCGRGGDVQKWKMGNVDFVHFTDIADKAVEECESRCENAKFKRVFTSCDATRGDIWRNISQEDRSINLASCQFALHYCFESIQQAYKMLDNVARYMAVNGIFVGILPNSYKILEFIENSKSRQNEISSITMDSTDTPLFGGKYHFKLADLVDCPEYLVYFPLLEKIMEELGFECTLMQPLTLYFYFNQRRHLALQRRMNPLRPVKIAELQDSDYCVDNMDYSHFESVVSNAKDLAIYENVYNSLSKDEWEVANLYLVFEFKKLGDSSRKRGSIADIDFPKEKILK